MKGKEIPIHPFWDEIRHAMAKDHSLESKFTITASELRKNQNFTLGEISFSREVLTGRNIPAPIRNWEISANSVLPQEVESATSFERLVSCPLSWTLRYVAKVRAGNALSIPHESLILGKIGHKILEILITEKSTWKEDEVSKRTGELFDEWSPLLAAPLLELHNGIKRNDMRFHLQNSMAQFFALLRNAGIRIHNTEISLQKKWSETVQFKGTLDLIGETATGKKILIDAKWSGKPKKYKERLSKLSVQLSLYHWLLSDKETEELPVAYFMLRGGEFFSRPHEDIPSDYHVDGPSLLDSIMTIRKSVNDVWSQLSQGTVIASGIATTAEHDNTFTPLIEPSCDYCDYQNLCGSRRLDQ
ncbi:RecB family exonuclease [Heliorestis convoluta]|uniref:RecB family exonuclease n=1 Tax=Heliorestis convoluta TaxID=356322 RepID=UPI001389864A|nr:PD-(D/E)XK nuclease family protein [Heliorestis convoluta]